MRPAWSCSTPSSSSGSRTSAAPAWPAPPARRPGAAASAWTSTSPAVPRREEGMEPWEVMTSESQERMLAIVTPESWPAVAAICAKWEVRATVIGTVTEPEPDGGGRLRIRDGMDGPVLADVPAASLSDDAPLYDRPRQAPARVGGRAARAADRLRRRSLGAAALAGLGLPPVRPPALPQHRGRAGRRRRAAPPGRAGAAAVGPRGGADDRLQPAGLRAATRGVAPRSPWPRAWPTWPASARRRPQS